MNKALKIADLQEGNVSLGRSNLSNPDQLTNLDTEEIRSKIKAARLEKLMARQLESELTFDLEAEPELVIEASDEEITLETLFDDVSNAPIKLEIPASKSKGYSIGSSKRMRNMQTTRHSCDEMVTRIRSGSHILTELNEQTTNLVNQLQSMEQEFANFEEAEVKASKLASEHKRITTEYNEALNLIEKQSRQLNVLDQQRTKSNADYENTRAELEQLQIRNRKDIDLFAEVQIVNSELEQEKRSLNNQLTANEASLSEATSELQTTNNMLKQKDMEAARALAELTSTKERLQNAETSLAFTSEEHETLSKQFTEAQIELQSLQSQNEAANDELASTQTNLKQTTKELEELTADAHDKDISSAKLTSDYASLIKQNSKVTNDLNNIQNKYDELNKSALEQQSQQYARIHELESVMRDVKRQLEFKTKTNAELTVELEATNNLLVLHEEMVTALSKENNR